ncbi:hypothetical protein MAR_032837 [Mya arenaria]|uniref:Uncharacterized protein n=1 Tax=Mya arenaria TaxID=6604 RepID=A0ABY7G791_MYAAR|nr:hypothetical protein MAR_032830 [Mya arenaria]WAR30295.1 hypothetical protein MAR_032837 [Mya arenaria]
MLVKRHKLTGPSYFIMLVRRHILTGPS